VVADDVALSTYGHAGERQVETGSEVAHGDDGVDGGFADVGYVGLVPNNELPVKITGSQAQIEIHPVIKHFVVQGDIELINIEIRFNIRVNNTVEFFRPNLTTPTLGNTGVIQPHVRQHRNRMLEKRREVRVAVAVEVEILFNINGRILVDHFAGEIGIPIANVGANAQDLSIGEWRGQGHRATYNNHQFTHNAPVFVVVLPGQSNFMPRRRPTSS